MLSRLKARLALFTLAVTCLVLGTAGVASATDPTAPTVDYSGASNGLVDAISPAIGPALVVLGIVAGVLIGIRVFKKVSGAKTA